MDKLFHELSHQLHAVEHYCRAMETALGDDVHAIRGKQLEFRQRTDRFFAKSYLMHRARTWPRGYPGDYEIIESAYNNRATSQGMGRLLDRYFLASTLARGIQHRREMMREMLATELRCRQRTRVLNIGCGPCREVLELAPVIRQTNAHFTNIDFDTDALLFSAHRLREAGIAEHVDFRQYNAIRMVNAQKNLREFGQFDVIYTIGLLDYLSDEILVRMIKALHAILNPNGLLIGVFKDSDQYETEDYHWLVDWSGFLQRTAEESRALFDRAGIASQAVTVHHTCDNVMLFYRVLNTADTTEAVRLHGPHDRRHECDPSPENSALLRPERSTPAPVREQERRP